MIHRLLFLVVCAAVFGAACSSNTSKHCYIQTETVCWDIAPPADDESAVLVEADAGDDAGEGGAP